VVLKQKYPLAAFEGQNIVLWPQQILQRTLLSIYSLKLIVRKMWCLNLMCQIFAVVVFEETEVDDCIRVPHIPYTRVK
jgi:hypothetical protein